METSAIIASGVSEDFFLLEPAYSMGQYETAFATTVTGTVPALVQVVEFIPAQSGCWEYLVKFSENSSRIIFSSPATKENCVRTELYKRGCESRAVGKIEEGSYFETGASSKGGR